MPLPPNIQELKDYIYPVDGDVLLHKKGGYYKVLIANVYHTELNRTHVVYQSLKTKEIFTKPWELFTSDRFTVAIPAEQTDIIKGEIL